MTKALKNPRRAIVGNKIDMKRRAEIGQQKRARTRARILAATFELYGRENGLFTRVEEICLAADVTRQTFYNHFNSMEDLREALTYEVTHDFLVAVTNAVISLPDAAERSSAAMPKCCCCRASHRHVAGYYAEFPFEVDPVGFGRKGHIVGAAQKPMGHSLVHQRLVGLDWG
jgi:AcrR family transcriptional regulator